MHWCIHIIILKGIICIFVVYGRIDETEALDLPADMASFSCSNKLYLQYLLFICGSYHFVKSPTGLCAAVRHDVLLLYVLCAYTLAPFVDVVGPPYLSVYLIILAKR